MKRRFLDFPTIFVLSVVLCERVQMNASAFQHMHIPRVATNSPFLYSVRTSFYSVSRFSKAQLDDDGVGVANGEEATSVSSVQTADYEINSSKTDTVMISQKTDIEDENVLKFGSTAFYLTEAALVGILTGLSVAVFKLSVEELRGFCYQQPFVMDDFQKALVPAAGGIAVGILYIAGGGAFPPGLRQAVQQVDSAALSGTVATISEKLETQLNFLRKLGAAVFTLGTGASLGPEGPCVELGMNVARGCMDVKPDMLQRPRTNWNLVLLNCGAAAGVAAGFNAPIAGVFFTLEVMQSAIVSTRAENNVAAEDSFLSATENLTPVLLASVLSALVSRTILGDTLVLSLKEYSLQTPLVELPLYLVLGVICGFVSFSFTKSANLMQSFFAGKEGPAQLQDFMKQIPDAVKPTIGGLVCGFVAIIYPQILFFGYETLNSLLANNSLPLSLLLALLFVKTFTTAVSVGSGLVGGTFAPSLFLGAMTGAVFHNVAEVSLAGMEIPATSLGLALPIQALADVPAYAMIGSASVLAALFRAPLSASLLLFEVTRDYDIILPLMASAGLASLVDDILQDKEKRRDQDSASWGDLAVKEERSSEEKP